MGPLASLLSVAVSGYGPVVRCGKRPPGHLDHVPSQCAHQGQRLPFFEGISKHLEKRTEPPS